MRVEAKDAVAALSELSEMGFTHGFRIQNGRVMDVSTGIPVAPAEVVVVTKLRFKPKAPRRTIGVTACARCASRNSTPLRAAMCCA